MTIFLTFTLQPGEVKSGCQRTDIHISVLQDEKELLDSNLYNSADGAYALVPPPTSQQQEAEVDFENPLYSDVGPVAHNRATGPVVHNGAVPHNGLVTCNDYKCVSRALIQFLTHFPCFNVY